MSSSFEKEPQAETKVILEFMRHGEKDPNKTEPKKTDEEVRLTSKGKAMAVEKGKSLNPQPEVSIAWGSPKKRTQETAAHVMLANQEQINPEASLEEMEATIDKELNGSGKTRRKIIEDERLSFDLSGPAAGEMLEAFKAGKYIPFLVEKSDDLAIEKGDKTSTTYLRQAGNLAEIVSRYAKVGVNFNRIASKKDDYKEFGNQLERYLGTHQGVAESFIAKILEKTEGKEKRDAFVVSMGTGFKELQGMSIEILNRGEEQEIVVRFEMPVEKDGKIEMKQESVSLSKEILEDIIRERGEFEKKVLEHAAQ